MASYAYYNGKFGKIEDISIPITDRSIYFGDCIYDAAIGRFNKILWEDEHIERFLDNAEKVGINHNYTNKIISELLCEVAIKSMIENYFIYFSLSRNNQHRNHSALNCNKENLLITIDKFKPKRKPKGLKLKIEPDKRYEYCNIKSTNLLPAVLSLTEAERANFDEVVFHRNGIVTECAKSNIFMLYQGSLITAPLSPYILPGITRSHLLKIAKYNGINVLEQHFTVDELMKADEILVTSTTKLCQRVVQINDVPMGGNDSKRAVFLCKNMYNEYLNLCCPK